MVSTPQFPTHPLPFIACTKEEAAKTTGLSLRTIEQYVNEGLLTPRYNGRRPLFLATDLVNLIRGFPPEPPNTKTTYRELT